MNNSKYKNAICDSRLLKRSNGLLATSAHAMIALSIGFFATPLFATPEGTAEPVSKTSSVQSKKDVDLLAKFKANNWSDYIPQHMPEITAAMASNAALREEVLQRFQGAADNVQRHHFGQLLRAASIPGFPAKAIAWARDSKNGKTRASAFAFLSEEEKTPEIQTLFFNALMQEQDLEVLGRVVRGFMREDMPDAGIANQVVLRLHELAQHESVDVRAGSLQRLADWDTEFRFFPVHLMRLLSDPDLNVRVAAIGSTSISNYTSEPLKLRLLEILGDPKEALYARSVAAMNIARFEFKGAESVKYKTALAAFEEAASERVASVEK